MQLSIYVRYKLYLLLNEWKNWVLVALVAFEPMRTHSHVLLSFTWATGWILDQFHTLHLPTHTSRPQFRWKIAIFCNSLQNECVFSFKTRQRKNDIYEGCSYSRRTILISNNNNKNSNSPAPKYLPYQYNLVFPWSKHETVCINFS